MRAQRAFEQPEPPRGFLPNPSFCPTLAEGKRVRAHLANGQMGKSDGGSTVPDGWAADGRNGCRWRITGSDFDIAFYQVIV